MATVIPFEYDFKAVSNDVDENGDIWISGYASDWGEDRQSEYMEPGCFEAGLKSFLEVNPIMLWHHQPDKPLGAFTQAYVDAKGLFVKGRIDKPAPGSWAEDVVNKVLKGTIRSMSVGGVFKRRGNKIYSVDLAEISLCALPVNARATFNIVANAALDAKDGKAITAAGVAVDTDVNARKFRDVLEALHEEATQLRIKRLEARTQGEKGMVTVLHALAPTPAEEERHRQQIAAAREVDIRRQRQARDGRVITEIRGDLWAALRGDKIASVDPFDQRIAIDPTKGYLTAEETQRLHGVAPAANLSPSPEQQFRTAEREEDERSTAARIRDRFAAALKAKDDEWVCENEEQS